MIKVVVAEAVLTLKFIIYINTTAIKVNSENVKKDPSASSAEGLKIISAASLIQLTDTAERRQKQTDL